MRTAIAAGSICGLDHVKAVLSDRHDPVPLNIALPASEGKKKARNMSTTASEPAIVRAWSRVIALDGGTTNTRARLIQDGRIVAYRARADWCARLGSDDRAAGQSLAVAVRDVIAEVAGHELDRRKERDMPDRRSDRRRRDALFGGGPAGGAPRVTPRRAFDELADAVVLDAPARSGLSPSISFPGCERPPGDGPDGWMRADVMRGEECETLGALAELTRTGVGRARRRAPGFRLAGIAHEAGRGRWRRAGSGGARPLWRAS